MTQSLFGLALTATSAEAQSIGVEIDAAVPVGDAGDELDVGWGVAARVGYGLPIPVVTFALEAVFDYTSFGFSEIDERLNIWRVLGGLRLGVGIPYVPELFVHVGYGSQATTASVDDASDPGFAWDIGVSSNLVSVAILSLGVHLAYKSLNPSELEDYTTDWIAIGIHGELF